MTSAPPRSPVGARGHDGSTCNRKSTPFLANCDVYLRMWLDIYSRMFDDPSTPSPPATVLETTDAVFWITLACVGLVWGLYVAHMRNCDETRLDAKSSATD